jgi:hypothetical protein
MIDCPIEADAKKYSLLKARTDAERKRNDEEEKRLAGRILRYGQIIEVIVILKWSINTFSQLVHFSSNMLLAGDRKQSADLESTALRLFLRNTPGTLFHVVKTITN